jgi:hypothetical protein
MCQAAYIGAALAHKCHSGRLTDVILPRETRIALARVQSDRELVQQVQNALVGRKLRKGLLQ